LTHSHREELSAFHSPKFAAAMSNPALLIASSVLGAAGAVAVQSVVAVCRSVYEMSKGI